MSTEIAAIPIVTLIMYLLFCFIFTTVYFIQGDLPNLVNLQKQYRECQTNIPRNQNCIIIVSPPIKNQNE